MEKISKTMSVGGKVSFETNLSVEGSIHGEVSGKKGNLTVEEGALINGNVVVKNLVVHGIIEAENIIATETVRVSKTGKIIGATIAFHTLGLEEGSVLWNCRLEHKPWPRCGRDGNQGGIFEFPAESANHVIR